MRSPKRKIIVFAPHPDDEVIACGGTILKKRNQGCEVRIVYMTDGSHSHSAILNILSNPTPQELAQIRFKEAECAAKVLGVEANGLYFLKAEDTLLQESKSYALKKVKKILQDEWPIAEIYLPHINELNIDHCLTNMIVSSALKELALATNIYYYVVWNEDTEREFGFSLRYHNREETREFNEIKFEIDISYFIEDKIVALFKHKSQVDIISLKQTRSIIPASFIDHLKESRTEVFWCCSKG